MIFKSAYRKPVVLAWFLSLPAFLFAAYFPSTIDGGSEIMADETTRLHVSLPTFAGYSQSSTHRCWFGYLYSAESSFRQFLQTEYPFTVHPEPAQAASSRFISSPDRSIRLSWSSGRNTVPVRYEVYFGTSPFNLPMIVETGGQTWDIPGLNYLTDYFWQIKTVDDYGRSTLSPAFAFSLSPAVEKFYCAPNPLHAGSEATSFVFNMPGPGSAELSIYALPSFDRVYTTTQDGLPDGTGTILYNETDNHDRVLFNGVYLAVIDLKGEAQHVRQKTKLLVVR